MTLSFKTNPKQTNIRHNNRELTEKEFKSDAHKHIKTRKIEIQYSDFQNVILKMFIMICLMMHWTLIMRSKNAKIGKSMIIINTSKSPKTWTYKGSLLLPSAIRQIGKSWVLKKNRKWEKPWRVMCAILTNDTIIWPFTTQSPSGRIWGPSRTL